MRAAGAAHLLTHALLLLMLLLRWRRLRRLLLLLLLVMRCMSHLERLMGTA
jgi:hypothetical protein